MIAHRNLNAVCCQTKIKSFRYHNKPCIRNFSNVFYHVIILRTRYSLIFILTCYVSANHFNNAAENYLLSGSRSKLFSRNNAVMVGKLIIKCPFSLISIQNIKLLNMYHTFRPYTDDLRKQCNKKILGTRDISIFTLMNTLLTKCCLYQSPPLLSGLFIYIKGLFI